MSTKPWQLSRRALLRGAGITMALPLLDAMQPLHAATDAGQVTKYPTRMACLFMPNGVNPDNWTPDGLGEDFKLSYILDPLASLQSELLVLSNLEHAASHWGDGHYVKTASWLTGTAITKTTGADVRSNGVSLDQLVAQNIGNFTPMPSMELSLERPHTGVDLNVGFTQLYGHHISWSTPHTPVARQVNPRLAFDRMFRSETGKAGGSTEDDRSVLDAVLAEAKSLRATVGVDDQRKLDEYLDSVRSVERRIAFENTRRRAEYLDDPIARSEIESLDQRITDVYADPGQFYKRGFDHTEHTRLMMDLIMLAFWTDSTRVATFMFGNAVSGKNFSFLEGVEGGFHQLSHHENDQAKMDQYARINRWHVEQYAYLLEKLWAIPEGEGTLLDNCMVMFGSALRDGNRHSPRNLPIVLAGRGGGTLQTGRHIEYPFATPLAKLYMSMAHRMNIPVKQFADATEELPDLASA